MPQRISVNLTGHAYEVVVGKGLLADLESALAALHAPSLLLVTDENVARHHAAARRDLERPISILCGRHDHWVGFEDAMALARRLPDAELTLLPGCGHLLPLEEPVAFGQVLERWLERCKKIG